MLFKSPQQVVSVGQSERERERERNKCFLEIGMAVTLPGKRLQTDDDGGSSSRRLDVMRMLKAL